MRFHFNQATEVQRKRRKAICLNGLAGPLPLLPFFRARACARICVRLRARERNSMEETEGAET